MNFRAKSAIVKFFCAVLCWAFITAPFIYYVSRDFNSPSVLTTAAERALPHAAETIVIKEPLIEEGRRDCSPTDFVPEVSPPEEASSPVSDIKILSADGSAVKIPKKQVAAVKDVLPAPKHAEKPAEKPADESGKAVDKAVKEPGVSSPQLYDTYALLPQPDGSSFVYYEQTWPAYTSYAYGHNTLGGYGCGPTSMAMVISNLTNQRVSPTYMADWSVKNGYYVYNTGTAYGLFPSASSAYGIPYSTMKSSDKEGAINALKSGKLLITVVGPGNFSRGHHFLLFRGITAEGKLLLADSGKYANCLTEWDYDAVAKQICNGQFWVFG